MTSNELKERTKQFAHRCVHLSMALPKSTLGSYISSQLIRSSLSTAANYRAACLSQSKRQFSAKISIVLEESDESLFWIEFIKDEKLLALDQLKLINEEAIELTKIFAASRLTVSKKREPKKEKSINSKQVSDSPKILNN